MFLRFLLQLTPENLYLIERRVCGWHITITNCYASWQAYENFIFEKEEFLNTISMFLRFLLASHSGELYLIESGVGGT